MCENSLGLHRYSVVHMHVYFIMQYIKGTPTSGTIPLRENLGTFEKQNVYRSILCQAIKGLAHLHSLLDFNNRDPKPIGKNIILIFCSLQALFTARRPFRVTGYSLLINYS